MPAELADDADRIRDALMAHRVDVWDHLAAGIAECLPFGIGMFEEGQVIGAVHAGARARPVDLRRHDGMAAAPQATQESQGSFGLFGGLLDHAADAEELREVGQASCRESVCKYV